MADEIYIKHNLGSFQQPYIFQQPGIGQTPAIGTTRYPFIGNTRQPNTYQFRTPQTYQAQGSSQEPNIRDAQEPNIRNAQEPNIGNSRQPNIRDQQEPNIRSQQEPNIRDQQQPNIRRTPSPYPYIANSQVPNIGNTRQPNTYTFPATYNIQTSVNYQTPFTYDIQTTGNTQQPNIRQQPAPYTFPTTYNVQTAVNYQTPFTYPFIGQTRSPFTYSFRSPSTVNIGETLQFNNNAAVDVDADGEQSEDLFLSGFEPPNVAYEKVEISYHLVKIGNFLLLYGRLTNDSQTDSVTFARHNASSTQFSLNANTVIANWSLGSDTSLHPTGLRFVVTKTNTTDNVNLSGDNTTTSFTIGASPHATTSMASTTVNSTSASGSFTSMTSNFSGGITIEQDASSIGAGFYGEGDYDVTSVYQIHVQFARPNSNTLTQSSPLVMSITNSTTLVEEEDDCPECCVHEDMLVSVEEDMAKSIHNLKIGDNVISHNFETGQDEIVEIEDIIIVERDVDYRVNTLVMTEDHPVYLEGGRKASVNPEATAKNYGQDVDQLVVGDKMIKQDGSLEAVESIDKFDGTHTNFAIKTKHNNFYADGHLVDSVIRRNS